MIQDLREQNMDFYTWSGKKFRSRITQEKQTIYRSKELSEVLELHATQTFSH